MLKGSLATAIRDAVRVLDRERLPSPCLKQSGMWAMTTDSPTAYAYNETVVRYRPTAHDISKAQVVETWLVWVRQELGDEALRLIFLWARAEPIWRIADRFNVTDRTIRNRLERLFARIANEFVCDVDVPEAIEESATTQRMVAEVGERPKWTDGAVAPGKVWVDGVGWMRQGEPLRNGYWRAERYL